MNFTESVFKETVKKGNKKTLTHLNVQKKKKSRLTDPCRYLSL